MNFVEKGASFVEGGVEGEGAGVEGAGAGEEAGEGMMGFSAGEVVLVHALAKLPPMDTSERAMPDGPASRGNGALHVESHVFGRGSVQSLQYITKFTIYYNTLKHGFEAGKANAHGHVGASYAGWARFGSRRCELGSPYRHFQSPVCTGVGRHAGGCFRSPGKIWV